MCVEDNLNCHFKISLIFCAYLFSQTFLLKLKHFLKITSRTAPSSEYIKALE